MKRKRGHKTKKSKQTQTQSSTPNPPTNNQQTESPMDDPDSDNTGLDSPMDADEPPGQAPAPALGLNHSPKPTNTESDALAEPRTGRVKVKLKSSSKMLEPKNVQSEEQSQGGVAGNSVQEVVEKVGEDANPVPRREPIVFYRMPRKAGSIKIKSSGGVTQVKVQGGEIAQTVYNGEKGLESSTTPEETRQKEMKSIQQDPRYNDQELKASLGVIQKEVKSIRQDPRYNEQELKASLGDYFDIIENPMDFGTICNNIESGNIYMNSVDVFRDVQYIWDNCYKYNNKGDYILDLMKRVKKNFTKYWTAAGLYSDQHNKVNGDYILDLMKRMKKNFTKYWTAAGLYIGQHNKVNGSSGTESAQVDTIASSSKQKFHVKGTKHKSRRRHGINRHKSDCQCAVCVVRRRRKEREEVAPVVENQIETSDGNLSQEFRLEGEKNALLVNNNNNNIASKETFLENPSSEDESSKLERSTDPVAVVDLEGKEELMPHGPEQRHRQVHEKQETIASVEMQGNLKQSQDTDKSIDEPNTLSRPDKIEDLGNTETNDLAFWQKEDARETYKLEQKNHASLDNQRKMELRKSIQLEENHLVMELFKTLFPNDCKNVWTGPHSLVYSNMPLCKNSAMRAAMDMFMQ